MEQANNIANGLLQTMAAMQGNLPKTSASTDGADDFQKLLEKKAQEKDSLVEEPAKTPEKAQATAAKKTEKVTPQKQENALERAKKLAEQGAWFTQPDIGIVDVDLETGEVFGTYEPGEYILAHLDGQTEIIPTTDMAPWEQAQLQQLVSDIPQPIDVSDPKADAMLEATAPGADNSPAAMLEKVVAEQTGQEVRPDTGEAQPRQEQDNDTEVELIDVEQGPQRIFHDVKAAPVKVGEVERPQEAEEPDVVQQLDGQIGLAIERGDSSVTVRLNPENLGEVTIQITMKDNGILSVALNAKNDATRALLDRHSDNLQQLLSSRVRETVEVDVQRQSESQQGQNQQHQNYDGHNGHAQDGQERRRRQQEPASSQDFMQQLRLGLIPADGEL